MTLPAQIAYCTDLAQMQEYANAASLAGAQMDATNRENGALYQPEIILWIDRTIQRLRLNAMAEGTHFARRTEAYNVAEEIIAAANRAAAETKTTAAPEIADMPEHRAKADWLAYRAPDAMAEIMCTALASHWWRETDEGRETTLGTLQICDEHGPMWYNVVSYTWEMRLTPGCLLTGVEAQPAALLTEREAVYKPYAVAGRKANATQPAR